MDPDATLARVRDQSLSLDERREALRDLTHWHRNGGFPPAHAHMTEVVTVDGAIDAIVARLGTDARTTTLAIHYLLNSI